MVTKRFQWTVASLLLGLVLPGCEGGYHVEVSSGDGAETSGDPRQEDGRDMEADDRVGEDPAEEDGDVVPDAPGDEPAEDIEPEEAGPTSCGFDYDEVFTYALVPPAAPAAAPFDPFMEPEDQLPGPDAIAHMEPLPPFTYTVEAAGDGTRGPSGGPRPIVMPGYSDTMPLFERGADWTAETRCYETPAGVRLLTQDEAFDLYRSIAELTTGVSMDVTPGVRSVVGIRGAYPGRFVFHGNLPDRFNDTIVLLWIDGDGRKHVREFPVNTDTGAHDFGDNASSSLRANRRYPYVNGWHRTYNALHIDESGYRVRDDTNKNGHWDSDRNGWLPPAGDDHDRTGSGHNIHMGSVDAPLGSARVDVWSAGCQVIPGMANWTEFINSAWTSEGDPVSYFLVDVRDIDPRVWAPCEPDGSHACPFIVSSLPFTDSRDTAGWPVDAFDVYNCSTVDESGPEVVYVFTVDRSCTVAASVDCVEPVDLDVHLLDGDDPDACLARDHISFEQAVGPGRYFLITDTFVDAGVELSGPFTVHLDCP